MKEVFTLSHGHGTYYTLHRFPPGGGIDCETWCEWPIEGTDALDHGWVRTFDQKSRHNRRATRAVHFASVEAAECAAQEWEKT